MSVSGSLMRQIKNLEKHHTKANVKCEWKTEVNLAKKKLLIQVTSFSYNQLFKQGKNASKQLHLQYHIKPSTGAKP